MAALFNKRTIEDEKSVVKHINLINSELNILFVKRFFVLNEQFEFWIVLCSNDSDYFLDTFIFGFLETEIKININFLYVEKEIDDNRLFLYDKSIIKQQIEKFQLGCSSCFIYDFNHDGSDEILSFAEGGQGISYSVGTIRNDRRFYIFSEFLPFVVLYSPIEFINYKSRQGIKFFDGEEYAFYYYDRIQRKYVRDESASPEELEQIQGSPDFFAEAGIDYTKLERPLAPADLEGFSKAALRIWRNAVYARHGRRFASEDLQALFNEYAWYKPDEEYCDDKLTDTDRANIKLIQEYEKK